MMGPLVGRTLQSYNSTNTRAISYVLFHAKHYTKFCVYMILIHVPFVLSFQTLILTLCTTSFNIQKFCVLPTHCIYVFCVDLRTNSDYFSTQH